MSSIHYAKEELKRLRTDDEPDEMQDMMDAHILKMVQTFADEGHSGFSAAYAIGILEKLLRFEPLTPLTGDDGEWSEVGPGQWQNRRCPRVFKDENGAYDIDGIVWRDSDGCHFTNRDSRVSVTFPYTPTTEYRDAPRDAA